MSDLRMLKDDEGANDGWRAAVALLMSYKIWYINSLHIELAKRSLGV